MRPLVFALVIARAFSVGCECGPLGRTGAIDGGDSADAAALDAGTGNDAGAFDAGGCDAGAGCASNPSAPCLDGVWDCAAATCLDAPSSRHPGVTCGSGLVCAPSGACVACADGQPCLGPSGCRLGVTNCATGAQRCVESQDRDAGAACDAGMVCNGQGACLACVSSLACSGNPGACWHGETSCSTGAATCLDSTPRDAGTGCGANHVCDGLGACNACTSGLPCTGNPGACRVGVTACSTGAQQCVDSRTASDAGTSCGAASVCAPDGACVACQTGAACATNPNAACSSGALLCASGVPTCVDAAPLDAGTLCDGANHVCLAGVCTTCASSADCPSRRNCVAGACELPLASCLRLRHAAATAPTGVYWIDSDGDAGRAPFQVHCEMDIDDGGWTLITALTTPNATTEVAFGTLITPKSPNHTYRDMRLPEASELLLVQDGDDTGFATSFDKQERVRGVTGATITWPQVMDSLNRAAGNTWVEFSSGGWTWDAQRLNTSGCLQTALAGGYGNGNHGSFNVPGPSTPSGANSLGTLWWHWSGQGWIAGTAVFTGPPGGWLICNAVQRDFTSFSNTVYLR